MKITNLKAMFAKVATIGLLAGAVILAAPGKADAQVRVGVGIGFGVPVYAGPVYRPRYYAPPVIYGPRYGYGYGYGPRYYGHAERFDRYEHYRYDRDRHEYGGDHR